MTEDSMYAWQVQEPDGRWGNISAYIPALKAHGVLISSSSRVVEKMRPIAEAHRRGTGKPVRLVKFTFNEEIERLA